ncbi:MAG TPA: hypothetical protein VIW47_06750, partial [Nitrospiraceae bacterium]
SSRNSSEYEAGYVRPAWLSGFFRCSKRTNSTVGLVQHLPPDALQMTRCTESSAQASMGKGRQHTNGQSRD